MQLTHVEISLPTGTLTDGFADDLDRLLTGVFGWSARTRTVTHPTLGRSSERTYAVAGGLGLVLRERDEALGPGTEDHLGFAVDPDELDRILDGCQQLSAQDGRVALDYVVDGRASSIDLPDSVLRTFFVRYLLPISFQFEARQPKEPPRHD
jgi:hypothetical protein